MFMRLWTDQTLSILPAACAVQPKAALSSSIRNLLCISPQWRFVPGTVISSSTGHTHFLHIPHTSLLSAALLWLLPTPYRHVDWPDTHQHAVEAMLELFLGWHRKFRPLALLLGASGHHLGLLGLGYLRTSCCVPHECRSDRAEKK